MLQNVAFRQQIEEDDAYAMEQYQRRIGRGHAAGPYSSSLYKLSSSRFVPEPTGKFPLDPSEMLKLRW